MNKTPNDHDEEILEALDRVTNRFWDLAANDALQSEGVAQVAVGLSSIIEELQESNLDMTNLGMLVQGLDALADLLEDAEVDDSAPTVEASMEGLDKFINAFRAEAQKRMAGLSISMMGIFNTEASEKSIEQSAGHLHAIRGGAGMLGLRSVATLSGLMEDVILGIRRLAPDERDWPVKPLLRGFSILKALIEAPQEADVSTIGDAIGELNACLDRIGAENRNEREFSEDLPLTREVPTAEADTGNADTGNEFDDGPITDVRTRPLEKRILVVDDVDTIAASVGLILSELDIPVDVASEGKSALELLHKHPYSLVISDVAMPEMDGLELTRAIREDEALADIPVILLTALDTEEERQEGLDAGADDYIVKGSIGGGDLRARVNELLQDAPYVPAVDADDSRRRRILIAEDTETVAASIAFVLSEGPYDITLAHDGKDALHRLRQNGYDLLISDVQMPSMDGIELLETIRSDDELGSLPVVLLTAQRSGTDHDRAREADADRFLIKGDVGAENLLDIVSELIEGPPES